MIGCCRPVTKAPLCDLAQEGLFYFPQSLRLLSRKGRLMFTSQLDPHTFSQGRINGAAAASRLQSNPPGHARPEIPHAGNGAANGHPGSGVLFALEASRQFEQLIQKLQAHEHAENELLLAAIDDETGTID